jgi:hypothetical protein
MSISLLSLLGLLLSSALCSWKQLHGGAVLEHLDLARITSFALSVNNSDFLRSIYVNDEIFYCIFLEAQI